MDRGDAGQGGGAVGTPGCPNRTGAGLEDKQRRVPGEGRADAELLR